MYGGHAWVKDERGEEGTIEVVDCLRSISLILQTPSLLCCRRTNNAAIVLFTNGSSSMPSCSGSEYIMYNNVIKPGASIVAQPILPGILKRDFVDVLPIG